DNVVMIQPGEFVKAGLNIILHVVLSITACYVGYQLMM
ncbi:fluoride efflux transporter CrcB, partial [Photobacterium damselae]